MKKLLVVFFTGLLLVAMVTLLNSAPTAPAKIPTLESLLKESKMDYVKIDGGYKVFSTIEDKTVMIFMSESSLGDNPDLKMVSLFTMVCQPKTGVTPPLAMYKKIAELNDTLLIGRISANEGSVFYNSSFFLRKADADSLVLETVLAQMISEQTQKDLKPFMTGE